MVSVKVDSKSLPDSCMIKKYKKKTRMAMMYNSKYVKKKAPMNCNIIYRDTRYSLAWAYSIQNERFYKYDLIFNPILHRSAIIEKLRPLPCGILTSTFWVETIPTRQSDLSYIYKTEKAHAS